MPSVNPLEKKYTTQTENGFTRQQKTGVVLLAIFSLAVIVLGIFGIYTQINRPFQTSGKVTSASLVATTTDLHLIDTDGDGLSDYDEINVYHTSPYLEDTDSDGIPDKQEIMQGTDPNCPTGKICNATDSTLDTSGVASSSLDDLIPSSNTGSADIGSSTSATSTVVTPAMLRQILLQNGYDQATLDKISDADIMSSYQDAINNQNNSSGTDTNTINQ